ncbi:2-oxoglutarate and iron-dependent oxygenase domain-containing protein [Herbiconiux sp.]|uniref:isopenicillin N synthase family dioxygenase n=1 Tax=Herbiconiux sp. TaxID=1871186 RepID=UPI0025BCC4E5|nr:2-oxoglutarate and iron-dependent oxygenase domain-containing protein [Herbiconiux sp.]
MTTPSIQVPTIDIDRDPARVGAEIDETLRSVGFFQIVGHGVPDAVADRCWQLTRAYFDLPLEDKLAVERREGSHYGYFPIAAESLAQSLDAKAPGDLKESLNAGRPLPAGHRPADAAEAALFEAPRWPEASLPGLRPAWEAYLAEMTALSERLLSIFALGLGLDASYFADKVDAAPVSQRAINYPEQALPPEEGQLRAGAHTDYGTLTILRQELGRGGLQVHDAASDSWVDIPSTEGALVINIGDLMARWTNDRWTSTLHRVVNPDAGSRMSNRRQSMPFFHNANYSQLVECLPTCAGPNGESRYEPVLAGPHLAAKAAKAVSGVTRPTSR